MNPRAKAWAEQPFTVNLREKVATKRPFTENLHAQVGPKHPICGGPVGNTLGPFTTGDAQFSRQTASTTWPLAWD